MTNRISGRAILYVVDDDIILRLDGDPIISFDMEHGGYSFFDGFFDDFIGGLMDEESDTY